MRVAVAISPKATSPADTAPMKIVARLVDSLIAAVRAPCRVKCSVVTNATALGGGAAPPAPVLAFWSLLVVSPAFKRRPGSNYRSSHEPASPMSRAGDLCSTADPRRHARRTRPHDLPLATGTGAAGVEAPPW